MLYFRLGTIFLKSLFFLSGKALYITLHKYRIPFSSSDSTWSLILTRVNLIRIKKSESEYEIKVRSRLGSKFLFVFTVFLPVPE